MEIEVREANLDVFEKIKPIHKEVHISLQKVDLITIILLRVRWIRTITKV
jgi:hypothetical protein